MLMEKFKTHEWILLSLYISNPDVGDTETEQSMVVYEVSISGYRQMEEESEVFPFHLCVSRKCKFFPEVFPFCESLFHFISERSIVCHYTKNT